MDFQVHTKDTAPEGARETLEAIEQKYGFVPNIFGVMAEAPALLKAYATMQGILGETTLTPVEQQVVLLAVSNFHQCTYCMAAHSTVAKKSDAPDAVVQALREGRPLPDEKLEALRRLAVEIVETRGWPSDAALEAFLAAGYGKAQVLEVIVGVAMKTLSNFTNHLADTPTDEVFEAHRWERPAA